MNVRNRLLTILALVLSTSCMVEKGEVNIRLPGAKNFRHSEITKATVTNVQIINDQLVITGTNLNVVTNIKAENASKSFSESFTIESKTSSQIIANSNSPLSFAVNSLFNLVLSNSYGAATFQINFSLCDATINGKGINCSVVANDKDVLSYDSVSDTWRPRQVNGLNYLGTFDASPGIAPTAQPSGSYYVISVSGTIGAINFDVGDWIVSNGSAYQKIDNSTAIISVFGRTGAVTGVEGDYSLDLLSDVDLLTTPPTAGKILKYNGTQWVVSDDLSSGGAGSVSSSEIADGTIATADLANASVTDAKINSVAASKITGTVNGTQVGTGVITNSHIAAGAAIDYSKLNITNNTIPYAHINIGAGEIAQDRIAGFSTALANLLTGTITNGDTTHAPTGDAVFDALGLKLNLTGGTLTMGTINGVPTPVNGDDIVNKAYVDSAVTGATTTANDKVSKTGDTMTGALVLPSNGLTVGTNQLTVNGGNVGIGTTTPQAKLDVLGSVRLGDDVTACSGTNAGAMKFVTNTVYYCNGSTWTAFSNSGAAVSSTEITDGSIVNADINAAANIAQSKIAGLTTDLSNKQPLDTGLTNLAAFNSNGILVQSADNTFVGRSIAGTANRLDVTNGDGVSGNPTLNINPTLLPSPTVGGYFLKSTGADASAWSALTSGEITTALGFTPVDKSGDTISTGTITFNAIGTLALGYTPTNLTDATSKSYVDNLVATAANQWTESSGNIYRNSGNVGIGTTTPAIKLEVAGSGSADSLRLSNSAGKYLFARYSNISDAAEIGGYDVNTSSYKNVVIPAGNVGVGTTSPNSKLEVNGQIAITANSDLLFKADSNDPGDLVWFNSGNDERARIHSSSGVNKMLEFSVGNPNSTKMVIRESGNVGIGTTSPNSRLEVLTSTTTESAFNKALILGTSGNGGQGGWIGSRTISSNQRQGLMLSSSQALTLHGDNAGDGGPVLDILGGASPDIAGDTNSLFRIMSTGNVGIGTTSPEKNLHVVGSIVAGNSSVSGEALLLGRHSNGQYSSSFGSRYSSGGPVIGYGVVPKVGGNGYTSSYSASSIARSVLHISDGLEFLIAPTQGTATGTDVTNFSTALKIDSSGNVGIGTSTPSRNMVLVDQSGGSNRGFSSRTYANNSGGVIEIAGALGTQAAPLALTSGKALGYLAFSGFDGSNITLQGQPTGLHSFATENWSTTAKGSNLFFVTTPNGTANGVERMRIDQNGNVGIGTAAPQAILDVNGNVNTPGVGVMKLRNQFNSGGTRYWQIGPDGNGNGNFVVYNEGFAGAFIVHGQTTWSSSSDKRLKKNIEPLTNSLEKINKLNGVKYHYKKDNDEELKKVGVIAQDVNKVLPEAVTESDGFLSVKYTELIPLTINAIKEFYTEFKALVSKVLGLETQVEKHSRAIASIEERNKKLEKENVEMKRRADKLEAENKEVKKALCELGKKAFCR